MSNIFTDFTGTSNISFVLNLTGVRLKDDGSGNLLVRNNADNAYADISFQNGHLYGTTFTFNAGATESGASWKTILGVAGSGQTADVTFLMPNSPGSVGQILQTDGNNPAQLSWVSAGSTAQCISVHTTALAYGDSSPKAMITLPANAEIVKVVVLVDTAFTGGTSPQVSIGVSGTASKYMAAAQSNLGVAGMYEVHPSVIPDGSSEALIATYAAGGSTAGAARLQVWYGVPTTS